jgi:glycosyltransferase involved in cell wall biosynthesis
MPNITDKVDSLHVIASKQFGGADQFFIRLVRALNQKNHKALAVTRPKTQISQALTLEEQCHVPMQNIWDLWSIWSLRKMAKRLQTPIVQSYMGRATRLTHVPKGAVHVARLGGFYKIKGYFRHAHAWVVPSKGLADYLVQEGLPARNIHLIGNFVDTPRLASCEETAALRQRLALPENAHIIFALGRHVPVKGFDLLLQAFAHLKVFDNLFLVLGGEGPETPKLIKLAKDLSLNGRVIFPGWITDIAPYYALANLFVLSSVREGLGCVLLEAMSYGVPIVATKTAGALELIEHEHNGLLVDRNPNDLADAVKTLVLTPTLAQTLTDHAKNSVAPFSEENIIQRYLELYRTLAS